MLTLEQRVLLLQQSVSKFSSRQARVPAGSTHGGEFAGSHSGGGTSSFGIGGSPNQKAIAAALKPHKMELKETRPNGDQVFASTNRKIAASPYRSTVEVSLNGAWEYKTAGTTNRSGSTSSELLDFISTRTKPGSRKD